MFKTHESNMRKKSFPEFERARPNLSNSADIRSAIYFLKLVERFGHTIGGVDVVKDEERLEHVVRVQFCNGHVCTFRESEMFTPPMIATVVMFYDLPMARDSEET